ncbi:glycosyltransferase [Nocardia huaxiensis]|uniref:Glycosyltransferase n=1 Tax=Nocardia huaxiensis TaxID=2755382 RepID=A0A7D6Z6I8_9NOCA|nr:nucleotide disphospho-sugar-binding domain-containing protein [Nocardia huaxiensis]QLY32844.1 glycosyltransferase [Nocardia huaxiensis]UFS93401.1 glycosyltransferase [Nocardia huaxiensis]
MAKILVFTSPAKGHLYPVVPVLAELVTRGHDITVVTLPDSRKVLEPLGISVRALPPVLADDTLHDWDASSRIGALRAVLHSLAQRIPHEMEAMRRITAQEQPDVLLVDITTPGAQTFAASSGLLWASWAPMLLPIPSRDVPPFGLGLRPLRGPLGRLRNALVQWGLNLVWDQLLPDLNAARQAEGLPELRHAVDYLAQPPLILNFTARPFDDVRSDWPTDVQQIGPGLWAPAAEIPQWLTEIDRPLAVVTCSTEFQDDGVLAQTAMDALADSDLYTVVTAGALDPASFRVPANARVVQFIPHHLLLDRAAVVVSHGGMGITQKALDAGVPVCVVPFGRDQAEVARRVVSNGAGTSVSSRRLAADRLRKAILRARDCRAGAQRVGAGFAAAGGPQRGADLLETHFRIAGRDRIAAMSGAPVGR